MRYAPITDPAVATTAYSYHGLRWLWTVKANTFRLPAVVRRLNLAIFIVSLGRRCPSLPSVSNKFRRKKRSPVAVAAGDRTSESSPCTQPRRLRALPACRSCLGRSSLHPSKRYLGRRSAPGFPSPSWSTRSCRSYPAYRRLMDALGAVRTRCNDIKAGNQSAS